MTENDKRILHEWHDANYDEEILKMREKANILCEKSMQCRSLIPIEMIC